MKNLLMYLVQQHLLQCNGFQDEHKGIDAFKYWFDHFLKVTDHDRLRGISEYNRFVQWAMGLPYQVGIFGEEVESVLSSWGFSVDGAGDVIKTPHSDFDSMLKDDRFDVYHYLMYQTFKEVLNSGSLLTPPQLVLLGTEDFLGELNNIESEGEFQKLMMDYTYEVIFADVPFHEAISSYQNYGDYQYIDADKVKIHPSGDIVLNPLSY